MSIFDKQDVFTHEASHLIAAISLGAPVEYLEVVEVKGNVIPVRYDKEKRKFIKRYGCQYEMSHVEIDDASIDNIKAIIISMAGVAGEILLRDKNSSIKQNVFSQKEECTYQHVLQYVPVAYKDQIILLYQKFEIDLNDRFYPFYSDAAVWKDAWGDRSKFENKLTETFTEFPDIMKNLLWSIVLQLIHKKSSFILKVVEDLNKIEAPTFRERNSYPSYFLGDDYILNIKKKWKL